jgi:hypothetical protein
LTTLRTPGEPGLEEKLGKPHRNRGIAFRRFEDERIPAGKCRSEFPHRDHGREIERRYAGHNSEGLSDGEQIDAGSGTLAELAFEQVRDAAGELDDFEAALDVASGIGNRLAVLAGQELGEAVEFPLDQFDQPAEDAGAALRVRGRPGRLCGLGNRNCVPGLGATGEGDPRLGFPGVRIEYVAEAAGSAFHPLAADEMTDLTHEASGSLCGAD